MSTFRETIQFHKNLKMESVCRLCMRQSTLLAPVFSFENGRLLLDLIALICPIKIDVNDNLPKNICEECKEIVISANILRETSVRSDIAFKLDNFTEPVIEKRIFVKREAEINIINSEHDDDEASEGIISLDRTRRSHCSEKGPTTAKKFKTNSGHKGLMLDQTSAHSISINKHPNRSHNDGDFPASKLIKKFPKISKINSNKSWSRPKFPCDICGEKFSFLSNMYRHKRNRHSSEPFACGFCEHRFHTERQLKQHEQQTHEEVLYQG